VHITVLRLASVDRSPSGTRHQPSIILHTFNSTWPCDTVPQGHFALQVLPGTSASADVDDFKLKLIHGVEPGEEYSKVPHRVEAEVGPFTEGDNLKIFCLKSGWCSYTASMYPSKTCRVCSTLTLSPHIATTPFFFDAMYLLARQKKMRKWKEEPQSRSSDCFSCSNCTFAHSARRDIDSNYDFINCRDKTTANSACLFSSLPHFT
jgi:hypothetical protein